MIDLEFTTREEQMDALSDFVDLFVEHTMEEEETSPTAADNYLCMLSENTTVDSIISTELRNAALAALAAGVDEDEVLKWKVSAPRKSRVRQTTRKNS